jgi:hypothetical protein
VIIGCRSGKSILLVDVVLYAGEREMLDARRDILQADLTVVVEGDRTFTGKSRTVEPLTGVVHCVTASALHADPWENEWAQRRYGLKVLEGYGVPDDAVVGFFDVDEIPDPDLLRACNRVSVWDMAKYQMSLAWYQQDEMTGISALYGQVKNRDVAELRRRRHELPKIRGGYHLSSFLPLDRVLEKWEGFSHQELVRADMRGWVRHCWENGIAIENGEPLTESEPRGIPARLFDGPDYWRRVAPAEARGASRLRP